MDPQKAAKLEGHMEKAIIEVICKRGWGAKGDLDLGQIERLAKEKA